MLKELHYDNAEKLLSATDWLKLGKPIQWLKVYAKNDIIVYEDVSYGGIKLVTPEGTGTGKDFAFVGNYVVFGWPYKNFAPIHTPYKKVD